MNENKSRSLKMAPLNGNAAKKWHAAAAGAAI